MEYDANDVTPEILAQIEVEKAKYLLLLNGRTVEQYELDVEAEIEAQPVDPEMVALFEAAGDDEELKLSLKG